MAKKNGPVIFVRCTAAQRLAWNNLAVLRGVSLAELVRNLLAAEAVSAKPKRP